MKKPKSKVENNFRLFFAKELKKKRTKNVENKLELNRAESKKRYAVPKKLKKKKTVILYIIYLIITKFLASSQSSIRPRRCNYPLRGPLAAGYSKFVDGKRISVV